MKTTLRFRDLSIHNSWYALLEQHLDHWQRLTAITAADVLMEREFDGRAAIRVQVLLELSGGDLHAEARGRTLRAALVAVTRAVKDQVQDRQHQRLQRRASERQPNAGRAAPSESPDPDSRCVLEVETEALRRSVRTEPT